ncbi:hypothetical protein PSAT104721_01165 [Pseudoalteromonas atlantica]
MIARKIRYLVVLNENFLTQIATRLVPQNDISIITDWYDTNELS